MAHRTSICLRVFISLALIIIFNTSVIGATDNHSIPPLDSSTETSRPLLSINVVSNIGKPGALLCDLESVTVVTVKYQVNCSSLDTVFTVFAMSSDKHVAVITYNSVFQISCADALPGNLSSGQMYNPETTTPNEAQELIPPTQTPDYINVKGEVEMTVHAKLIGRSILTFLAEEHSSTTNTSRLGGNRISPTSTHDQASFNERENEIQLNRSSYKDAKFQHRGAKTNEIGIFQQESPKSSQMGTFHQQEVAKTSHISKNEDQSVTVVGRAMLVVVKFKRTLDIIFRIVLYNVVVMATIGMGVKMDFLVIKSVLRNPVAPVIGLCCQYLCMPLIAYGVAKVVPQESAAISLGIFTCGIVPGGGMSNMFTVLLGGDLSLSATMTAMSNIAALGLLPLWLFTLGNTFQDQTTQMHVPYEKILEALALVILPLLAGMLIKYKLPKVAHVINKILKPVLLVVVTFTVSLGIYTNFFIFKMISPMTIFAGCLLPYVGYLIGGFISFACFRSWTHIKTIAIETGIQNTGIAFLILFLSLQPPDNQLAAVAPAASAIMTPQPLLLAVVGYTIYKRCTRKHRSGEAGSAETTDAENGNADVEKKSGEEHGQAPGHRKQTPLIVVLWRKLAGRELKIEEVKDKAPIKELNRMLPQKDSVAKK